MLDFFWMIGSLLVIVVWVFLYFQTRKKVFLVIAAITLVADFFVLQDLGITLESFKDFII
jgi:ABC-type transport system involved in cytochrome bd biosynthesis fused ATPase/permease subunit